MHRFSAACDCVLLLLRDIAFYVSTVKKYWLRRGSLEHIMQELYTQVARDGG